MCGEKMENKGFYICVYKFNNNLNCLIFFVRVFFYYISLLIEIQLSFVVSEWFVINLNLPYMAKANVISISILCLCSVGELMNNERST